MQSVDICIVGAGPGGALASYLLGKKGFNVLLIERTSHTNKAFRGEHINEEGERILKQYGFWSEIEQMGCLKMETLEYWDKGLCFKKIEADPSVGHLGIHVPQQHLLDVVLKHATALANVTYYDETKLVDLVQNEYGAYVGVDIERNGQREQIATTLIIGADGRFSTVRKLANIEDERWKNGYDVLWARIPAPKHWSPSIKMAYVNGQQLSIFTQTNGFIQIGWNIEQGSFSALRKQSFQPFIDNLVQALPQLKETVAAHIQSWKDFVLLDVFSSLAQEWGHDGVVLIGDAAHTMTPTGAFGLNSSLRDAEIIADILTETQLRAIDDTQCATQRKREVQAIQNIQKQREQQFSQHFVTHV